MKTFKYLTVILAAALAATGCYDDEGSYYTGSWTEIARSGRHEHTRHRNSLLSQPGRR